jgi:hypothetical protein
MRITPRMLSAAMTRFPAEALKPAERIYAHMPLRECADFQTMRRAYGKYSAFDAKLG